MLGDLSDRNLIDRMIKKKNNKSLFFRISILVSQIYLEQASQKIKQQITLNWIQSDPCQRYVDTSQLDMLRSSFLHVEF